MYAESLAAVVAHVGYLSANGFNRSFDADSLHVATAMIGERER
jgi:hypothetical protein